MPKVLSQAANLKDRDAAAVYITDYCNAMQSQAFLDAKQLPNDVVWMHSQFCNTLKMQRNPETHEVLDEEGVVPPMEVTLDASTYGDVPPTP